MGIPEHIEEEIEEQIEQIFKKYQLNEIEINKILADLTQYNTANATIKYIAGQIEMGKLNLCPK